MNILILHSKHARIWASKLYLITMEGLYDRITPRVATSIHGLHWRHWRAACLASRRYVLQPPVGQRVQYHDVSASDLFRLVVNLPRTQQVNTITYAGYEWNKPKLDKQRCMIYFTRSWWSVGMVVNLCVAMSWASLIVAAPCRRCLSAPAMSVAALCMDSVAAPRGRTITRRNKKESMSWIALYRYGGQTLAIDRYVRD